jgi:hypothetical protein
VRCLSRGPPLADGGLGEAVAGAFGEHDVDVVQEPVDGGGGQGFGHDGVEAIYLSGGAQVAGDGDRAAFVGGVGNAVERFGGGPVP